MLKPYFPELFKTWLNSELTRGCVYQDAVKTCLCMTALLCSLKKEHYVPIRLALPQENQISFSISVSISLSRISASSFQMVDKCF